MKITLLKELLKMVELKLNNENNDLMYWNQLNDIDLCNINNKGKNELSNNIVKKLVKNYSIEELTNLLNFIINNRKILESKIKSNNKYNLSVDEIQDVSSYIVGMGYETYTHSLNNLDIIEEVKKQVNHCFEYDFDEAIYQKQYKMDVI